MPTVRLAALLLVVAAEPAWADDPAPEPAPQPPAPAAASEEVIVVTGLRLPRPLSDVPAATTVIDRDQIARAPEPLADDLVRAAPGVGTFRRSSSAIADPTSQGLNLRGVGPSGVSRALVLQDGIPVNDPFGGWVYWRALSPLGVDRIEIVPSGASALFGNFALGGVLQVISRPIDGAAVDAVAAGGSLGGRRGAARVADRFGDLGVELDGESWHSDGYTPIVADQRGAVDSPAASDHGTAGGRVEYTRGSQTLHAGARLFTESLNAGTQFTTADVRTVTYGAGWRLTDPGALPGTLDVELFGGTQRFDQDRARVSADRMTAAKSASGHTPSDNQGAAATWTARLGASHAIVVGADAQRVVGTATDTLYPAALQPTTIVKRAAGGEQRFAGVFAQDAIEVTPQLEVAAALRLDGWQNVDASSTITHHDGSAMTTPFDDASKLQLDPRLGALYHISHEVAVRASAYRAFRAPTLNELYRPFQVGTILTAANDRLRPETLWGGELGTQLVLDGLAAEATAFWNQMNDPIANVTLATPMDGATRQRQNLGSTRIFGLDLDLTWRPAVDWTVRVAHTFSDGYVRSAPAQPDLVGNRLAQDPHHRTSAIVSYDNPRIATLSAELRYLGPQFEDDQNTQPIGSVVLFNARAERALARGFSVFVIGQNLSDRHYLVGRSGIDTEGAPRTFELGLAYHAGAR
ncbi:MAG TPA: TonB-dependent receptor [Kofleriaceae bacterium]|jgi:outer membrane receptor protein involved in Fe transport|nr:TonB-dependent receptor [Kofleriaceae bacterium]